MISAPRWYADGLGQPFVADEDAIGAALPGALGKLVARFPLTRGLALGVLSRRGHGVVLIRRARGSLPALAVAALPPARPRIFALELLRRPAPRRTWRRAAAGVFSRLVEAPLLRRALAGAQVMTPWEREEYAAHYRLPPRLLYCVGWPLREGGSGSLTTIREHGREVFSSGRSASDWETLFAAARGASWNLRVACSRRELRRVTELARRVGARVVPEPPWSQHDRLLRTSDLYAIVLKERPLSSGQARLMSAVEAGVPVVATSVRALEGYVIAGETAATVPSGDARALRTTIDALLAAPARRRRLRDAALARAGDWTYADYFAALRGAIGAALGRDPSWTRS